MLRETEAEGPDGGGGGLGGEQGSPSDPSASAVPHYAVGVALRSWRLFPNRKIYIREDSTVHKIVPRTNFTVLRQQHFWKVHVSTLVDFRGDAE
eukprot:gene8998-biopygen14950